MINAIEQGGSSIRDFKNTDGKSGNFQKNFKVYERNGLKCKRYNCKGVIQKKKFLIGPLFFVISVKNYDYFIDQN